MLNGFAEFTLALQETDNEIRDLIFKESILKDAISFLVELFPINENHKSESWKVGAEEKCLPMLLKTLSGMVLCHQPTQKLFIDDNNKLIVLLLELENISSDASIGEYASHVIENAIKVPSICIESVNKIKESKQMEAKEKAKAQKQKAMEQAKTAISQEFLDMMNDLDDEGWECCICKEGYEYFPKELLGIYAYVNRSSGRINTSTYFVCIHNSCHEKDRNGRDGWDNALVRNCEKPCNCIYPLPSSTLNQNVYKQALINHLDRFKKSDENYFQIMFYDVQQHLLTISSGNNIPFNFGGGSTLSIVQLLPFMIYGGNLFLDGDNRKSYEELLQKQINNNEMPIDSFILSLWILSLEEWNSYKYIMLKNLLKSLKVLKALGLPKLRILFP